MTASYVCLKMKDGPDGPELDGEIIACSEGHPSGLGLRALAELGTWFKLGDPEPHPLDREPGKAFLEQYGKNATVGAWLLAWTPGVAFGTLEHLPEVDLELSYEGKDAAGADRWMWADADHTWEPLHDPPTSGDEEE
jgi:hypothetical protein